jgi:hypothetical protein
MRASEVYEGYVIDAATHQASPMRWGWTYLIDGQHSGEGAGRPLRTEALALMDAVGEAKARIRHWLRSGGPPPKVVWSPHSSQCVAGGAASAPKHSQVDSPL